MRARTFVVLAGLVLATISLPLHGCGDNDNSGPPCCPVCGDGVCSGDEQSCGCGQDCHDDRVCTAIIPVCGDGFCQHSGSPAESHERCPADCPLDCRQCAPRFQVYVNGMFSPGDKCPTGATFAYREDDVIVCHGCNDSRDCADDLPCLTQCGPGCENDSGSCCPVRVCRR